MEIGLRMPYSGALSQPDNLASFAKGAEDLGFYGLYMSDHIAIPRQIRAEYPYSASGFDEPPDALELMTTLAYVAAKTSRIRLITGVMVVPYRNPIVAAKLLSNIDYLSKGRLIVGAGVGWMREEFDALESPFDDRGAVTDEYIRVFREVWTKEDPRFEGRYSRFSGITFEPKPFQTRGPPIWIGGESPRAMRRAATLGDGWMPIGANARYPLRNPAEIGSAIRALEKEVTKVGRKMSELKVGYLAGQYRLEDDGSVGVKEDGNPSFVGSAEKIISDIKAFERVGVGFLGFDILPGRLEQATESIEKLASRVVSRLD